MTSRKTPARPTSIPRPSPAEQNAHTPHFSDLASGSVAALQRALGRVLATFPDVKRSVDLKRRLNLDAALAWQIFSLTHSTDPLAASRFIPKAGAMDRFVKTIHKAGTPVPLREAVETAYSGFEALVHEYAGDRDTFAAIISALLPVDRATWAPLRRAAFRANTGVWGVSVECSVNCSIWNQQEPHGDANICVRGRVGIKGFRAGAAVAMSLSTRVWGGSHPPPEDTDATNMGEGVVTASGNLITDACSQPLPRVETRVCPDGSFRDYAALEGLGRRSESDLWWSTFAGRCGGSRAPPHGCSCPCPEPTALQVVDLIVPGGWSNPASVRARIVGPDVRLSPTSATGDLPFEGEGVHLGSDLDALHLADAPIYSELVTEELRRRGWLDTTFDLYRCTIKFPILHSITHLYVL